MPPLRPASPAEMARKRDEIIGQWLPGLVDDVLGSHEIAAGIRQAKLDRKTLRQEILDARQELLAPAEEELTHAIRALFGQTGVVVPKKTPMPRSVANKVVGSLVMFGPGYLSFWTDMPAWLTVSLFAAGLFTGLILIVLPVEPTFAGDASTVLTRWWQTCRAKGVLPYARRVVDERTRLATRLVLGVTVNDAPGLRSTDESSYVVRTRSVEAFLAAAERLPTGAIGIAGPRGVGKTSLIEYFAGQQYPTLKVMVSAPVQYEPRDFVLHLFASVCQAVLRERPAPRGRRGGVVGLARRHLEHIHYLRTRTTGWSGKVSVGSEAGWSRQMQRERRPHTYPELVNALREFLVAVAAHEGTTPAMIIAVDELDKIESADRAQQFLNEIKGIFATPGTQFLVSVSEEALASFERRGLPLRDAFDSAFQDIVRVDYLTLADTAELLSSRVLRLPEPFKWLVHCMSGGLPRDVVRTARAMVSLDEKPLSLDDVCGVLVAEDLTRKSHAFQLACRGIEDSPDVTKFIRSLRRLSADAAMLLKLVPVLRQDGELATLSRQAAAYVYYSATLLEVFTRDRVDAREKGTFDLLARAKQSLAVHPRLAWLQVDEFRESWGLATVPVD